MNTYIVRPGGIVMAERNFAAWYEWMWSHDDNPFEDGGRRVAETDILIAPPLGTARVSTVFLGIAHGFRGTGLPILFETMVFGDPRHPDYQERYCTVEEAHAGHARAVELVTSAVPTLKNCTPFQAITVPSA